MNFPGILASQAGCIPMSCTKGGPLDYPDSCLLGVPQQDFQIRIQHQFQFHWLIRWDISICICLSNSDDNLMISLNGRRPKRGRFLLFCFFFSFRNVCKFILHLYTKQKLWNLHSQSINSKSL